MSAARGRIALLSAALLSLLFIANGTRAAETTSSSPHRLNVLLICVDDLKPNLGCYGDALAKSPHLDALAKRSLLFERAYCNQAVCAPSRNSLLTGLRPTTLGIYDLGTNFRKSRPEAITLPQRFKQNGWRTEALGKIFHVGHGNVEDPASWSVPHWKANVIAYALPASRSNAGLTREEALFAGRSAQGLPRGAAYESAEVPDETYPDGALAEEAIRRLKSASEKPDEPFFLALGFVKPHLPFCAPKKYWDLYDRDAFRLAEVRQPPEGSPGYAPQFGGELRQYRDVPEKGALDDDLQRTLIHGYYACISYMDAQLGRVMSEVDRLGLAENTVIVLWGDHGWHLGDHGMWCKHTNYEQAAKIPLMIMAPGIAAGSRSQSLVETVDLYPTLCDLAGLPKPEGLDGSSLAAHLKDPGSPTKDHIVHVFPRQKPGVGQVLGRAVRTERYRLVEWKKIGADPDSADFELFDYQEDPLERKNLAAERPEIVAELREKLAQHPEARPQVAGQKPKPANPKKGRAATSKS